MANANVDQESQRLTLQLPDLKLPHPEPQQQSNNSLTMRGLFDNVGNLGFHTNQPFVASSSDPVLSMVPQPSTTQTASGQIESCGRTIPTGPFRPRIESSGSHISTPNILTNHANVANHEDVQWDDWLTAVSEYGKDLSSGGNEDVVPLKHQTGASRSSIGGNFTRLGHQPQVISGSMGPTITPGYTLTSHQDLMGVDPFFQTPGGAAPQTTLMHQEGCGFPDVSNKTLAHIPIVPQGQMQNLKTGRSQDTSNICPSRTEVEPPSNIPSRTIPSQEHHRRIYQENLNQDCLDRIILEQRLKGKTYSQIKEEFRALRHIPDSTLRGRFRMLTRPKSMRVRKPEWTPFDMHLLQTAFNHFSHVGYPGTTTRKRFPSKPKWKTIGQWMYEHGASYPFTAKACSIKWQELHNRGRGQTRPLLARTTQIDAET